MKRTQPTASLTHFIGQTLCHRLLRSMSVCIFVPDNQLLIDIMK